ncbi:MAG: hypothetical protein DRN92_05980 [Thermoproteota archaeon]|nr:MAG: hypothetical protein DRN92_05980 [Candidatus Korarchaeota archaeon]
MKTVGIDFGTSYCSLTTFDGADLRILIPKDKFPSCVVLSGSRLETAEEAVEHTKRGLKPHEAVIDDMKVMMGTGWTYREGGTYHTPQSVATRMLLDMMGRAGLDPGEIDRAVITVSTTFSIAQRKDLRTAAEGASLRNIVMLPEPAAAFIGWLYHKGREVPGETRIVMCDWGGGTLDLCYAVLRSGSLVVEGYDGLFLGGRDIDEVVKSIIANQYRKRFERSLPASFTAPLENRKDWYRMRYLAKGIKELLSERGEIHRSSLPIEVAADYEELNDLLPRSARPLFERIQRGTFERKAHDRFRQVINCIKRFINQIGGCDIVLLVGGSFLIPYVQDHLRKELEGVQMEIDTNFITSKGGDRIYWIRHFTATGAAIYARDPDRYPEVRDRLTYNIGLRKRDGSFDKVIARDTPRQNFSVEITLSPEHIVAGPEGNEKIELWEYIEGGEAYQVKEFPLSNEQINILYERGIEAILRYDALQDAIDLLIGGQVLQGSNAVIQERIVEDYLVNETKQQIEELLQSGRLSESEREEMENLKQILELPKVKLTDYVRVRDLLNMMGLITYQSSD